jgi:hypothetical protein
LYKYYRKYKNSRDFDTQRNAYYYKIIADQAFHRYFKSEESLRWLEGIRDRAKFTKKCISFITKLNISIYHQEVIDVDYVDLAEKIEEYFGDHFKFPFEKYVYKLTGSEKYLYVSRYLKGIKKGIGKVLIGIGVMELAFQAKGPPTAEQQMTALKEVWDFTSSFKLDKVCPGYGEFVSKAIDQIAEDIKIIKWHQIEKNMKRFSLGKGPIYPYVEFAGFLIEGHKELGLFKEWRRTAK